ncbi:MAG TPA: anhydro-N-acetylmuramic acid kinase [Dokdonella sp.]|uniref:anhydro-N-acetylmuramic acid kinase n=1 Tax=Dokdonella sp. TaxID=2291710 RepID=UPI002D7FFB90|nr:anhydro-N-acetylmuramic acid kinase [Dokdonella sp.]HET9031312.1 anhydro-N-acetylmuramic acid kinase [Dokdonella sp.]
MAALFLGLISGTSADGIDAALVRFEPELQVLASKTLAYPAPIRERLLALTAADARISLDEFGAIDVAVGRCFADAALSLLADAGVSAAAITAIGSHGQTVRHRPDAECPFSLQIGDATVIAERTGICTVADFRRADVAAGGQGAPLAPAFHAAAFAKHAPCAVLNLGGIANLSLLDTDQKILGFDTGPANCLLDAWNVRHQGTPCDIDGAWASSGSINADLLSDMLDDAYFKLPAPKSTGRETFNLDWLDAHLAHRRISSNDVQATLLALTSRSIADALKAAAGSARLVLACGGGVHNTALMAALSKALQPVQLISTAGVGVDPDFVEACLFAWLARQRLTHQPGNLPGVTGARGPRILGAIHMANA